MPQPTEPLPHSHRPPGPPIHEAAWSTLDALTGYRIAALRCEVFVVEQRCAYLDLDGRDLEPGATQLWCEGPEGDVLCALRVLPEVEGWRIGRVVTAPAARGRGLAGRLLRRVLERPGPFVLDAQSYLTDWYGGFGFRPVGEQFVEDGIPHTPMRRP